jgi:hypothetical protein
MLVHTKKRKKERTNERNSKKAGRKLLEGVLKGQYTTIHHDKVKSFDGSQKCPIVLQVNVGWGRQQVGKWNVCICSTG